MSLSSCGGVGGVHSWRGGWRTGVRDGVKRWAQKKMTYITVRDENIQ